MRWVKLKHRGHRGAQGKTSGSGSFSYCLFSFVRLAADVIGNIRQVALVGADRGKVVGLADEIERAQRFPYLLVCGIDYRHFGSCGDVRAGTGDGTNPSWYGGPDLSRLLMAV